MRGALCTTGMADIVRTARRQTGTRRLLTTRHSMLPKLQLYFTDNGHSVVVMVRPDNKMVRA